MATKITESNQNIEKRCNHLIKNYLIEPATYRPTMPETPDKIVQS